MSRVHFEEDRLVVESYFSIFFNRKIKIKYEDIERIEFPGGTDVLFYLKNGKIKKVPDPGLVTFYTGFGEMLKKYKIPFQEKLSDTGHESIETVREKGEECRKTALEYANRALQEKYGPQYEFEGKIVERIVCTTLEFRLLKNGVIQEEDDYDESMDGDPIISDMDIAYLNAWDPVYERGEYYITEEALGKAACEKYVDENLLKIFFEYFVEGEE